MEDLLTQSSCIRAELMHFADVGTFDLESLATFYRMIALKAVVGLTLISSMRLVVLLQLWLVCRSMKRKASTVLENNSTVLDIQLINIWT